jgi:hypothetical protein
LVDTLQFVLHKGDDLPLPQRCHIHADAGLSIINSSSGSHFNLLHFHPPFIMAKLHLLAIAFSLFAAGIETPHRRTYLYVGGNYSLNNDGEHIITNQMYVERLTPVDGPLKEYPIVLIHGADQTATVHPSLSERLT